MKLAEAKLFISDGVDTRGIEFAVVDSHPVGDTDRSVNSYFLALSLARDQLRGQAMEEIDNGSKLFIKIIEEQQRIGNHLH